MRLTVTESDVYTITTALRAAADGYSTDAHKADMRGHPQIAEQLRIQRRDALALVIKIRGAGRLV